MFDRPDWQYREHLSKVFKQLDGLSRDADRVPARIRCMLSDVLDLRAAGWQDQKQATKSIDGPMTIEEVHLRAADQSRAAPSRGREEPKGSAMRNSWVTVSSSAHAGTSKAQRSAWSGPTNSTARSSMRTNEQASKPLGPYASGERLAPRTWQTGNTRYPSTSSPSSPSKTTPNNRSAAPVDREKLRSELRGTLTELSVSHDIQEAMRRLTELQVPVESQPLELAHILEKTVEQGSHESRSVCFCFAAQLFLEGVFAKSALMPGLQRLFHEKYEDFLLDNPALPHILKDECVPALQQLVHAGFLSVEQLEALADIVQ